MDGYILVSTRVRVGAKFLINASDKLPQHLGQKLLHASSVELADHVKTKGRSQFWTGPACPPNAMRQGEEGLGLEANKGTKQKKGKKDGN